MINHILHWTCAISKETMDIMSDPGLMQAIREGEKELAEGKGIPYEQVKKELGWD